MSRHVFALMTVVLFLGLTVMPVKAGTPGKEDGKGHLSRSPIPQSEGRNHRPEGLISLEEKKNRDFLGEGVEDIEKQLKSLMEELKKLDKDVRGKVRKEVLPRLKREIERLREWLRKMEPKRDQDEPIRT